MAYELSASTQRTYALPEADAAVVTTDPELAVRGMVDKIHSWKRETKADHVIVCLSDDFSNFRKKVYPAYKSQRKSAERPVILYDMKDALADHFESVRWANVEADDVMGILSTEPSDERRCIVSADKDLATVPGWLWNPTKMPKPRLIDRPSADRWFLKQTLTGDVTDGFPGCPGIGPKIADEILDGHFIERTERVITKGKRMGEIEVKYRKVYDPSLSTWDRIVRTYEAKGLTEGDALTQARCAFILRHGHYEDGRVTLWDPSLL